MSRESVPYKNRHIPCLWYQLRLSPVRGTVLVIGEWERWAVVQSTGI